MYIDISISFDLIMLFSYSLTSLCKSDKHIAVAYCYRVGFRRRRPWIDSNNFLFF